LGLEASDGLSMAQGRPVRVIPRLDVKGANLVKGIHLEGLRVLGEPSYFAARYAQEGADELLFMDAVASLYGRNSLLGVIEKTARDIFIPLTVGGGIRTLSDIEQALRAGADKVAINTVAINNPAFITQAAERYGSSTIVVHIDAKKSKSEGWQVWTENGREPSRYEAVAWAQQADELGCGEILVTSIDMEGTTKGYDRALCAAVAHAVSVPVIACGGASSPQDVADTLAEIDLAAVSMSSILHYGIASELERRGHSFGAAGEFEVIAEKRSFARVTPASLKEIKKAIGEKGLVTRQAEGNHI
jgi:imidazole glycerol-phosphate synthase subunit HisF